MRNPIEIPLKSHEKMGKTPTFSPRLEVQILLGFAGALRGLCGSLRLALTDAGIASACGYGYSSSYHHILWLCQT